MNVVNIVEIIVIALLTILSICLLCSRKKLILRRIAGVFIINLILIAHLSYGAIIEKPILMLQGGETIVLEVNTQYQETGASAKYYNQDWKESIQIKNEVDTSKIGEYIVDYTINFRGSTIKKTRKVCVVDTTPPTLELKGKETVEVEEGKEYKEDGYTAMDNADKDITEKVTSTKKQISQKEYQIIYSVTDSSNNTATAQRTIRLITPIKTQDNSKGGTIYLTFDDGPSLDITPKILDILKEEKIKATFFILNYDTNRERLVKRIVDEGHTIGIHGYSHEYKQIYQSVDTYMNNITKLQDKIKESTGVVTKVTRFPGGSSNTVSKRYCPGIMTTLTKKLVKDGYYYYDWNVGSADAGGAKTKEQVYENVTNGLRKNRANIVLMHDYSKNTKTLDALRNIIQYGKQNGYTFDKITEKTPMITQKVAN